MHKPFLISKGEQTTNQPTQKNS